MSRYTVDDAPGRERHGLRVKHCSLKASRSPEDSSDEAKLVAGLRSSHHCTLKLRPSIWGRLLLSWAAMYGSALRMINCDIQRWRIM
jgi:hypothetical protein